MGGGVSRATSLTDNLVDIAVNATTSVDMNAFANLNARNNISIKNCHHIRITDVNQTISGLIDFGAFQQAVQATSQSVNMDQVLRQQQEMIAQSVNLSAQEMETATHNLTMINQTVRNAVSSSCTTSTNLTNNIDFEYCSDVDATMLRQENAAKVIQNCVMSSVQSSEQYTQLKQLLDQKSKMTVENSLNAFVMIIIAVAVLVVAVLGSISYFGASTFKQLLSWRVLIAVLFICCIAGAGFLIWYFLIKPKDKDKPASSGTPPGTPPGTASGTAPGTPPGTPSRTPPRTPTGAPPRTPTGTPIGTPPRTPPGTPIGTPTGTPIGTPTGTPIGTPTGTLP